MKPKLTPTTNDMLAHAFGNGAASPQPMQFPSIPLPPKKTRKPREQKANIVQQAAPQPQPLKIALIGTAPSSRMLAPYNDPTWTIWGCSPGNMNVIPRVDAWFEVHGTNLLEPENAAYAANYIKWMSELKCPVYMQDQKLVPHAISIQKDVLIREFGPYFFTSSFAWMMAEAIMAGASEIALYGIDMASRDEYIIQRPGAYHFFMEGARRGIKIWAPYESDIMQPPPLYGYSEVGPFGRKLRARQSELKERIVPMEQQRASMDNNITYLKGALEDIDYILSIQGGAQDNTSHASYLESLMKKSSPDKVAQPASTTLPSEG